MKKFNWALVCALVTALATWFNFPAILSGSPISIFNIIVTGAYILSWVVFVVQCQKNLNAMVISLIWGSMICFISVWSMLAIFLDIPSNAIHIIMLALFLTSLYGLPVVFTDYYLSYPLFLLFGLFLVFFSAISIWRIKHRKALL